MDGVNKKELKCIRYLSKEMSQEDKAVFEIELTLDRELLTIYQNYKLIWDSYPTHNSTRQPNCFDKPTSKKISKLINFCFNKKMAFAASILLLFSLATYYFSSGEITYTNHITTNLKDHKTIYLPDSTKVYLNGNSEIKYPNKFKTTRDVWISGEAFLDVEHNLNKPFIVHTKELDVQVLGTAFNVNTLTENKTISVERGKVKVLIKDSDHELNLRPNEELVFNSQTRDLTKRNFNLNDVLAWKDNMLILDNILIKNAITKINKFYGVTFYVEDERIANKRITGVFKDQDLKEFISSLEFIANISIQSIKNNKFQIKENGYD